MRPLVVLCVFVAVLVQAGAALARERTVRVIVAGDPREARDLELLVRDLLVRLGAKVEVSSAATIDPAAVVEKPPSFAPALARVWIDSRPPDHAMLYLVDQTWERVLVRRVARDPAHLEVCREDVGHILETAVEAMLAGAKIGVERATLRPPPPSATAPARAPPPQRRPPRRRPPRPKPRRPRPPRRHTELRVGVITQTTLFSAELPLAQAIGVSASLETPWRAGSAARAGGWMTLTYRLPSRTTALPLGVRLQGLEVRLLGRVALPVSPELRVELGFGPGVDVIDATSVANRPGATLTAPSADVSFLLRGAFGVRWRRLLGLLLVADADLTPRDYTFVQGGRRAVALSPFVVRPSLVLEAAFR